MPLHHEPRNVQCFGAKSTRAGLEGLHAACFIPLNPNAPQQTMAQRSLCSKTSLLRPQQRIHAHNVTIFGALAACARTCTPRLRYCCRLPTRRCTAMQLRRRRVHGLEQQLAGSRATLRKIHRLCGIPAAFCEREGRRCQAILAFAFIISCSDISLAATGESGFNDIMALICWRRHVPCFKRHVPGCGVLLMSLYSTQRRVPVGGKLESRRRRITTLEVF